MKSLPALPSLTGRQMLWGICLTAASLAAFTAIAFKSPWKADAASPTFSLIAPSGALHVDDTLMLTLNVDATGDDDGMIGAEVNIEYTADTVSVSGVNFLGEKYCLFESCLDLSETGRIRLIGVSSPTSEALHDVKTMATLDLKLTKAGQARFTFNTDGPDKGKVIDRNDEVRSRDARGVTFTIEAPSVMPPAPVPVPEPEPLPEPLPGPVCGNGALEAGETCDDGNTQNGDGCSATCDTEAIVPPAPVPVPEPVCGNGVKEGAEICDDGNTETEACAYGQTSCMVCAATCEWTPGAATSYCGDGLVAAQEQCDDNGNVNGDGCSALCTIELQPVCGNGTVESGETCDDGNTTTGDACSNACTPNERVLTGLRIDVAGKSPAPRIALAGGESAALNTWALYNFGPAKNVTSPGSDGAVYSLNSNALTLTGSTVTAQNAGVATVRARYAENGVTVEDTQDFTVEGEPEPVPVPKPEPQPEPQPVPVPKPEPQPEPQPVPVPQPEPQPEPQPQPIPTDKDRETILRRAAPEPTRLTPETVVACAPTGPLDSDGDGLSDRTECYLKTDFRLPDTDKDGCTDGEEVNWLAYDPTLADCLPEAASASERVVITDPQPGWILIGTLAENGVKADVSVLAPLGVSAVTLSFRDRQADLARDLDLALSMPAFTADEKTAAAEALKKAQEAIEVFLSTDGAGMDYADLTAASLAAREGKTEEALALLLPLKELPTFGAAATALSPTLAGGRDALFFSTLSPALPDRHAYEVTASAPNGSAVLPGYSRFTLDNSGGVNNPQPETLGGVRVGNRFAIETAAEEIPIHEARPRAAGLSEFGSQVYAVWQSVVLSSSVLSDSEAGGFLVQAPATLETDTAHRVTLFALKTDETGRSVRSPSVNMYFRVEKPGLPWKLALTLVAGALVLLGGSLMLRQKLKKPLVAAMPTETLYAPPVPEVPVTPQAPEVNASPTPPLNNDHPQA